MVDLSDVTRRRTVEKNGNTDMKRNTNALVLSLVWLIMTGIIMMALFAGRAGRVFTYLFRRGSFSFRRLQFVWEADPVSCVQFLVFVVLALIFIVNLFRLIAAIIRIAGGRQDVPPLEQPGDRTLSHSYGTGNERYITQLDDFLRDGVITKEEFIELKKRFGKENGKNGL